VPRGDAAQARIDSLYSNVADLERIKLDGLIVTGAEPRAATLPEEPYWQELTELVDWAKANTRSTIWSCLAAHAAVLHLDGIERRRLDQKCSGVYDSDKLHEDALLADLPSPLKVPHSRLNGIGADDLGAAGYQILTQSPLAGVDIFVRRRQSRFVFFQGHPEYDALSLQREYLRDLGRYLAGERDSYPEIPEQYFDAATEAGLAAFRERVIGGREQALLAQLPQLDLRPGVAAETEASATTIFRNWLTALSGR
jgi:homoserine O-succinyltransferase